MRGSGVFVRRLVRAAKGAAKTQAPGWTPGGTVVITGGTGAIGSRVARWLAGAGAEHLVLLSRRGADAAGMNELRAELEGAGARVSVAACDVADAQALGEVLSELGEPVRAVFHAAGIERSALLAELDADGFAEVVSAKVCGARNLDRTAGGRG